MGFHGVVLMNTFLLMYQLLANVGITDIDEARVIAFLGVRTDGQQTDTV